MIATIAMPKLMLIGGGSIAQVAETLGRLGVGRPLVVTDPYMRDSGSVSKLTDLLEKAGIPFEVFADTVPDPTTDVVQAGAKILAEGGLTTRWSDVRLRISTVSLLEPPLTVMVL